MLDEARNYLETSDFVQGIRPEGVFYYMILNKSIKSIPSPVLMKMKDS